MFRKVQRVRALVGTTVSVVALGAASAHAAVTAPPEGSVQRGDVTVTESPGASAETISTNAFVQGSCNYGAKSALKVTAADGTVMFTAARSGTILDTRGGIGPLQGLWRTEEAANGMYTATSTTTNRIRKTAFSCQDQVVTSSVTFELRKFRYRFEDARGKGTVRFNLDPKELKITLGEHDSGIVDGRDLNVITLPKGELVSLPAADPTCLTEENACVPTTPASCEADPGSCEERLVVANVARNGDHSLRGLFDLRTKAFAAIAHVGPRTEVLGNVADTCGEIRARLTDKGLDPDEVLGRTPVDATLPIDFGEPTEVPTTAQALCTLAQTRAVAALNDVGTGTGILGTPEIAAGLIVHTATQTTSGSPTAPSALPYRVSTSKVVPPLGKLVVPTLPEVPAETPLPATPDGVPALPSDPAGLVGLLAPSGPLTQVKGSGFSGTHVVGLLNADTAPGPDAQTPIWLPLTTAGTKPDKSLDFVGYGTAQQGQGCFALFGTETCIGFGVLIGQGAARFGPSPVQLPIVP